MRFNSAAAPFIVLSLISAPAVVGCSKEENSHDQPTKVQTNSNQVASADRYAFVGYSTKTVDGAGNDGSSAASGIAGMYDACRSTKEFGNRARMCTSREYVNSPNAKAPGRDAWLQPVAGYIAPQYFVGSQRSVACRSTSSNILDWGSVRTKGLTISPNGKMNSDSACNISRPVTCCAPR